MRKFYIILAIFISLLVVIFGYWHFFSSSSSYLRYQRIKTGMTLAEVQAVMGNAGAEAEMVAHFNERRFYWTHSLDHGYDHGYIRRAKEFNVHVTFQDGKVAETTYWESPSW